MIAWFRNRGLKALYEGRTARRVAPRHVEKLRDILPALDPNRRPEDMKGWASRGRRFPSW